jgi:hypothetical protein
LARRSDIVAKAGELFDRVSKRSGVVSNPRISRHDGHQLWRLAEQFCGRKMHRIEGANRFYGKGSTNTREHGVGDGDDEATTCEYSQPSHGSALLRGRQATAGSSPDDRPCGFGEHQRRRHLPSFSVRRLQGRRVAFHERRE